MWCFFLSLSPPVCRRCVLLPRARYVSSPPGVMCAFVARKLWINFTPVAWLADYCCFYFFLDTLSLSPGLYTYTAHTHTHTIRYNGPSSSSSSFFFFRLFFLLLVSFFSFLLMCLVFLQCLEEGEREKRKTLPSNCVCVGALLLYTVKQQYDVSRFAETLRHTTTIRRGQYYFHWKADFNQMPCLKKSIF